MATVPKTVWQLEDDNFRQQIDRLMAEMRTRRKADVSVAAGLPENRMFKLYESPRLMRIYEQRLLQILFKKYGLEYDVTLGRKKEETR